jgi:adenosylcobinamide kinase/adenosylcobinamide-phosphate guanylyltransferase
MGELIFILGGARSGKSQQAQKLAEAYGQRVCYLATCIPQDEEMRQRVLLHQQNRPSHWKTIEEAREIIPVLQKESLNSEVILLDCLTLLIFNLMEIYPNETEILSQIKHLCETTKKISPTVLVVSNEVGGGIVPENALARKFRDLAGLANQLMARYADSVYWMVAGIPVKIK